jgi:hypothetical protein
MQWIFICAAAPALSHFGQQCYDAIKKSGLCQVDDYDRWHCVESEDEAHECPGYGACGAVVRRLFAWSEVSEIVYEAMRLEKNGSIKAEFERSYPFGAMYI